MFYFFASGEGQTLLHSVTNIIPKLKEANQELVKDVDKRIRVSNKLLDAQQQNLGRVFAAINGIISGDDDGEAF
jgi:phosphoglycerate-specific signal transduction histidine kinase